MLCMFHLTLVGGDFTCAKHGSSAHVDNRADAAGGHHGHQQAANAHTDPSEQCDTPLTAQRMEMTEPRGVPMDRMGSGTTWIPDAAPLPARHFMAGDWALMLHGFVFVQEDAQGGPRGSSQLGSLNWGMFMASHALAG